LGAAATVAVPVYAPKVFADSGGAAEIGAGTARRVEVSASVPDLAAATTDAEAAAACNRYTRTYICQKVNLTTRLWVITQSGRKLTGIARMQITQKIAFSTTSNRFRESIAVKPTAVIGSARGLRTVSLGASCGQGCKGKGSIPRGRALRKGVTIRGYAGFTDRVGRKKIHRSAVTTRLVTAAPGYTPTSYSWKPRVGHRCDNSIYFFKKRRYIPGCVVPKATPTVTAMRQLPAIRANIQRIQTKGPGHWGQPGSGHPLHRLWNAGKADDNREAVCGRKVVGKPPKEGLECDEYPFASTEEGGTKLKPPNRGWDWVPAKENRRQGGLLTDSYGTSRILPGDGYYVAV
jgi:hypothetical protein